jgi:hypothetical protein
MHHIVTIDTKRVATRSIKAEPFILLHRQVKETTILRSALMRLSITSLVRRRTRSGRFWGYLAAIACALIVPGSAQLLASGRATGDGAGLRPQVLPPLVAPGTSIDSGMVRIVPFTGDQRMAIGIPFGDADMIAPQAPSPEATQEAAPSSGGMQVVLRP